MLQVVYGRNQVGSDGSGTLPKPPFPTPRVAPPANSRQHYSVGQLGAEDIQRLRAMQSGHNYANNINLVAQDNHQMSAISPRYNNFYANNNNSLVRTSNLELLRGPAAMRASSPLNQVRVFKGGKI